jgi:hypothetical protein
VDGLTGALLTNANPVRYRRCMRCGEVIDLQHAPPGLEWDASDDTFRHRDCDVRFDKEETMPDAPEAETTPLEPLVGHVAPNLLPIANAALLVALIASATVLALSGHPLWALIPLVLYVAT